MGLDKGKGLGVCVQGVGVLDLGYGPHGISIAEFQRDMHFGGQFRVSGLVAVPMP